MYWFLFTLSTVVSYALYTWYTMMLMQYASCYIYHVPHAVVVTLNPTTAVSFIYSLLNLVHTYSHLYWFTWYSDKPLCLFLILTAWNSTIRYMQGCNTISSCVLFCRYELHRPKSRITRTWWELNKPRRNARLYSQLFACKVTYLRRE